MQITFFCLKASFIRKFITFRKLVAVHLKCGGYILISLIRNSCSYSGIIFNLHYLYIFNCQNNFYDSVRTQDNTNIKNVTSAFLHCFFENSFGTRMHRKHTSDIYKIVYLTSLCQRHLTYFLPTNDHGHVSASL